MSTALSTKPAVGAIAVARTAPRRRSVAQGALAVLLIVGGALTAGYVVLRMGDTHDFLAVGRPVDARAEITRDDLISVRINDAVGLDPIPTSKIDQVIGKRAVMPLLPGTLLTAAQLTAVAVPAPGYQLIGLGLEDGQLPGSRLSAGVKVLLVVVPPVNVIGAKDNASELVPPQTVAATVVDVTKPETGNKTLVNVEVATAYAPTVAALAANERIIVTLAGS
jgi:hypothetical protein